MPLTAPHPHRPRALARLRPLALAALVAFAPAALAQQVAEEGPQRIEDRMTASQFRDAGLDQLSAEQLANLNAWFGRELQREKVQAAEKAAQWIGERPPAPAAAAAPQPAGGMLDSGSRDAFSSRLAGRFTGFANGRHYTLANGQVWEQVDGADLPGVELDSPKVELKPSLFGSTWYLKVEGYNTRAKVRRIK